MRIGELATRAGVTQKAIRYYERCGLVTAKRTASGYRDFDERALTIVQTIRQSQHLGMQVGELRDVIALINLEQAPCAAVRDLLAAKRSDVARRIEELQAFAALLDRLQTVPAEAGTPERGAGGCTILARAASRATTSAPVAGTSSPPQCSRAYDPRQYS